MWATLSLCLRSIALMVFDLFCRQILDTLYSSMLVWIEILLAEIGRPPQKPAMVYSTTLRQFWFLFQIYSS